LLCFQDFRDKINTEMGFDLMDERDYISMAPGAHEGRLFNLESVRDSSRNAVFAHLKNFDALSTALATILGKAPKRCEAPSELSEKVIWCFCVLGCRGGDDHKRGLVLMLEMPQPEQDADGEDEREQVVYLGVDGAGVSHTNKKEFHQKQTLTIFKVRVANALPGVSQLRDDVRPPMSVGGVHERY